MELRPGASVPEAIEAPHEGILHLDLQPLVEVWEGLAGVGMVLLEDAFDLLPDGRVLAARHRLGTSGETGVPSGRRRLPEEFCLFDREGALEPWAATCRSSDVC